MNDERRSREARSSALLASAKTDFEKIHWAVVLHVKTNYTSGQLNCLPSELHRLAISHNTSPKE